MITKKLKEVKKWKDAISHLHTHPSWRLPTQKEAITIARDFKYDSFWTSGNDKQVMSDGVIMNTHALYYHSCVFVWSPKNG